MRQASSLVLEGPLPHLPQGWGCLHSTHSRFFQLDPSSPDPIHGRWAAERSKASLESDGNREVLEAEDGGDEGASLLKQVSTALSAASPQDGKRGCPLRS